MSSHHRTDKATIRPVADSGFHRKLFWAPVIHTQTDLGSISESVRQLYIAKMGQSKWKRRTESVEELWDRLRLEIDQLQLDYTKVRLYQDGLPSSGHESIIVKDLAAAGSLNHRILLDMIKKGATLTGTESIEFLLEEYEMARQVMDTLRSRQAKADTQKQKDFSKALLDKRDAFIANRINTTLHPGETGLIFLGMLHSLEGRLDPDINLIRLGTQANDDSTLKNYKDHKTR